MKIGDIVKESVNADLIGEYPLNAEIQTTIIEENDVINTSSRKMAINFSSYTEKRGEIYGVPKGNIIIQSTASKQDAMTGTVEGVIKIFSILGEFHIPFAFDMKDRVSILKYPLVAVDSLSKTAVYISNIYKIQIEMSHPSECDISVMVKRGEQWNKYLEMYLNLQ